MLDQYYGVVQSFDSLSKELYALQQGAQESVAKFGIRLTEQVQILWDKFPRIFPVRYMEDVKRDCFYEGLHESLQTQLAHKMERDHLSTYDELLLAACELEKRREIKDAQQHLWKEGNALYPSHKLKGGIAKSMTMAK